MRPRPTAAERARRAARAASESAVEHLAAMRVDGKRHSWPQSVKGDPSLKRVEEQVLAALTLLDTNCKQMERLEAALATSPPRRSPRGDSTESAEGGGGGEDDERSVASTGGHRRRAAGRRKRAPGRASEPGVSTSSIPSYAALAAAANGEPASDRRVSWPPHAREPTSRGTSAERNERSQGDGHQRQRTVVAFGRVMAEPGEPPGGDTVAPHRKHPSFNQGSTQGPYRAVSHSSVLNPHGPARHDGENQPPRGALSANSKPSSHAHPHVHRPYDARDEDESIQLADVNALLDLAGGDDDDPQDVDGFMLHGDPGRSGGDDHDEGHSVRFLSKRGSSSTSFKDREPLEDLDVSVIRDQGHAAWAVWDRMHEYMDQQGHMRAKELFAEMDKDRNGKIDEHELAQGLEKMSVVGCSPGLARRIIATADPKGDGQLYYPELVHVLKEAKTAAHRSAHPDGAWGPNDGHHGGPQQGGGHHGGGHLGGPQQGGRHLGGGGPGRAHAPAASQLYGGASPFMVAEDDIFTRASRSPARPRQRAPDGKGEGGRSRVDGGGRGRGGKGRGGKGGRGGSLSPRSRDRYDPGDGQDEHDSY